MGVYKGSAASGAKAGVVGARPWVSRGFTELPSSAAHHELASETQNSELFRILLAFTGELGSWGAERYFYYTTT